MDSFIDAIEEGDDEEIVIIIRRAGDLWEASPENVSFVGGFGKSPIEALENFGFDVRACANEADNHFEDGEFSRMMVAEIEGDK